MSENIIGTKEDSTDEQNEISTKPEINEELNPPTTTIKDNSLTQITRDDAPQPSQITRGNSSNQSSANYSQFSHPVYKKISAANGRINRMSKDELIDALKYLGLNPK